MNKEIATYILQYRWWLKCKGIPKSMWRRTIAHAIIDSGYLKLHAAKAEDFAATWELLEKQGYL